MPEIVAKWFQGGEHKISVDKPPDWCPVCHRHVSPLILYPAMIENEDDQDYAQIVFRCTCSDCQRLFIGTYERLGRVQDYTLTDLGPKRAEQPQFSEVVSELSPAFVEICAQVAVAEAEGLHQLEGIGLRKALEFLVKDYAIRKKPDQEEDIRRKFLGPCISQHIDDQRVRECAKRASWLGNDETHYTRIWGDKDISDLRLLVDLTVKWLEYDLLTERYLEEMPES